MFDLAAEAPDDGAAIEDLLDEAFGADRHAKTSYRYRDGVAPIGTLSLTARADDQIIGSIRYWPILVGPAARTALLLGPLAISPKHRGKGIAAALIFTTLGRAAWAGHELVLLVGDLAYYKRFGFQPAQPFDITMPDERPERLLLTELKHRAASSYAGAILPWRDRPAEPSDTATAAA